MPSRWSDRKQFWNLLLIFSSTNEPSSRLNILGISNEHKRNALGKRLSNTAKPKYPRKASSSSLNTASASANEVSRGRAEMRWSDVSVVGRDIGTCMPFEWRTMGRTCNNFLLAIDLCKRSGISRSLVRTSHTKKLFKKHSASKRIYTTRQEKSSIDANRNKFVEHTKKQ